MSHDVYVYRKKGSKIWWARKRRNSKEFYKCLDTESESLGRKRAAQWIDSLIAEEWGEKPRRKFSEAAVRFAEEHFPTLKPKSAERYASSMVHLLEYFEDMYMDEITSSVLSGFEQYRRKKVQAPTIRRDLACLSSIFTSSEVWEWADRNPVKAFMSVRNRGGLEENEPRQRYLTHDEEAAILAQMTDQFRIAACAAIDIGARKSEQQMMGWPNVAFDIPSSDELMRARGQAMFKGPTTKSKKTRSVPLLDRSYDMLKYAQRRGIQVFARQDGNQYSTGSNSFYDAVKKAARRAGVDDVTWHDLRRTCGCRLLQDYKVSLYVVSRWLGHSSVKVTERSYAFLEVGHLHEAVEQGRANVIDLSRKRALLKLAGD